MRGEPRVRMRPTRGVPRFLIMDHQETHEGISFADFRNSCLTFLKGMPTRMNGISAQYEIVDA